MAQTILTHDGSKPQTKKERLELLRKNYYTQLRREIDLLNIRKKDLIMSYRITVKEIDEELRKIK